MPHAGPPVGTVLALMTHSPSSVVPIRVVCSGEHSCGSCGGISDVVYCKNLEHSIQLVMCGFPTALKFIHAASANKYRRRPKDNLPREGQLRYATCYRSVLPWWLLGDDDEREVACYKLILSFFYLLRISRMWILEEMMR